MNGMIPILKLLIQLSQLVEVSISGCLELLVGLQHSLTTEENTMSCCAHTDINIERTLIISTFIVSDLPTLLDFSEF